MSKQALVVIVFVLLANFDKGTSLQRERRNVTSNNNGRITTLCPNIELLRGRDGRDGPSGSDGQNGLPGRDGRDGMSGPAGPQGPRGDSGEPGPANGPPGPRGLQGGRGATGPRGQKGSSGSRSGGVIYTRWGHRSCPTTAGTRLVYAGRVGGSHYSHGAASNYLCMPPDPQYTLRYRSGVQGHSYVYGTEYDAPIVATQDHNVPCAVCEVTTREMVLMIPAKTSCPTAWTREYYGYLMSQHAGHNPKRFECVDRAQESVPGSQANLPGAQFYHVEAHCSGMQCPPYVDYKELNCVVCTK